jgi:hypothetical protein
VQRRLPDVWKPVGTKLDGFRTSQIGGGRVRRRSWSSRKPSLDVRRAFLSSRKRGPDIREAFLSSRKQRSEVPEALSASWNRRSDAGGGLASSAKATPVASDAALCNGGQAMPDNFALTCRAWTRRIVSLETTFDRNGARGGSDLTDGVQENSRTTTPTPQNSFTLQLPNIANTIGVGSHAAAFSSQTHG